MSSPATTHDLDRSCPSLSSASTASSSSSASSSCSISSLSPHSDVLSPPSSWSTDTNESLPSLQMGQRPLRATTLDNHAYPSPLESEADAILRYKRIDKIRQAEKTFQTTRRFMLPASAPDAENRAVHTSSLASPFAFDDDALGFVPMTRSKAFKPIPRSWVPLVPSPEKAREVAATPHMSSGQPDQYGAKHKSSGPDVEPVSGCDGGPKAGHGSAPL